MSRQSWGDHGSWVVRGGDPGKEKAKEEAWSFICFAQISDSPLNYMCVEQASRSPGKARRTEQRVWSLNTASAANTHTIKSILFKGT